MRTYLFSETINHRVLQGAAQRGEGAILLHLCGSPDTCFMQQSERFLPQNLHPSEGNLLKHPLN